MRADTYDLAAIFGRPVDYLVPLYQRPYVWTREKQWEPLWEDVRDVADRQLDESSANDTIPHFLGAIVLERSLLERGLLDGRTIIDGQQRLTTSNCSSRRRGRLPSTAAWIACGASSNPSSSMTRTSSGATAIRSRSRPPSKTGPHSARS